MKVLFQAPKFLFDNHQIENNFYFGTAVTITRLYLDNAGVPLSVPFNIKCYVSFLSNLAAVMLALCVFSGINFISVFC